jgi:hypothetical protein
MNTLLDLDDIFDGKTAGPPPALIQKTEVEIATVPFENHPLVTRHNELGRRGLIGNCFPPHPTAIPPDTICATPLAVCPRCSIRPVLRELREMTGGLCYRCWAADEGARS